MMRPMPSARLLLSLLLLFALIAPAPACSGGASSSIPSAGAMPAGASFEGVWYSEQFEQMYLRRVGDTIRGIYTYKYGGTLEGDINGDLLTFKWIEPGETSSATRTRKGQGYFKLSTDDNGNFVLKGRWGYEDDRTNGGVWDAMYTRALDPSDPKTLETWREANVR